MVLLISLSGCLVTLQNVQFLCECQCWDGKALIDHLKAHIVEGRPMSCTVTGCKHVWKFKLSFTQMHILFRLQSNNPTESVNYGPKVCKFVEVNIAWISTLRSFRGQHFHFLSESLYSGWLWLLVFTMVWRAHKLNQRKRRHNANQSEPKSPQPSRTVSVIHILDHRPSTVTPLKCSTFSAYRML